MTVSPLRRLAAVGLLAAVFAACSDSSGPPVGHLENPQATIGAADAMDSVFIGAQFQSLRSIGPLLPAFTAAPRLGAVLSAALPRVPGGRAGTGTFAALDTQALRALIPEILRLGSASASPAGFIADSLLGKTFEWDSIGNQYVLTDRAGAPTNGVRFILYAVDTLTGQPSHPITETGTLDVLDESTVSVVQLHLLVKGVGGTPTYVDYTFAISNVTANSATVAASGFIGDGGTHQLDFNVSIAVVVSQTKATISWNVDYSLNDPQVAITMTLTLTYTATDSQLALDLKFERPGETVRMAGTLVANGSGESGSIAVTVNGGVYATLEDTNGHITVKDHAGNAAAPASPEAVVCLRLFNIAGTILTSVDDLLAPGEALTGFYIGY